MTHTLEILVMLGIALMLGALLYHFAVTKRRQRLSQLQSEVERLQALEATLTRRLEQAEQDLETARKDLAETARVLAERPAEQSAPDGLAEALASLRAQQATMTESVTALRAQVEKLGPPIARI